jgi:hypothetical protein
MENIIMLCFKGFHITNKMLSFSGGGESRDQYKGAIGAEFGESMTSENTKVIFEICGII